MKSFKRILACITVCAMLFCAATPFSAFAGSEVGITVGAVDALPRDDVNVSIGFDNTSIGAFHFVVNFDPAVLSYTGCDLSDEFSGLVSDGDAIFAINPNEAATGKLTLAGAITSGAVFTVAPVTLGFTVLSDVAASVYSPVTLTVVRLRDALNNALESTVTDGGVDVTVRPLTDISLDATEVVLKPDGTKTLTASPVPADTTDEVVFEWASSNTEVASVENGVITALRTGTATITASAGSIEKTCTVKVAEFSLSADTLELDVGGSDTLVLTILPADIGIDVAWSSLDEDVATVENGVVTAVGAGETTITATAAGYTFDCTVTVAIPYKLGDLDHDDSITVSDALIVLRASINMVTLTGNDVLAADVDFDEIITVADSLKILRVAIGLSDTF